MIFWFLWTVLTWCVQIGPGGVCVRAAELAAEAAAYMAGGETP